MTKIIELNDGNKIPAIGFGTFQIPADGSTYQAVSEALAIGYRHIDTAVAYFNEAEVGRAITDSGIDRKDVWVTSKLWLQDYDFKEATKAIDLSLTRLGLDYIDLYLLHQPYDNVTSAWQALEAAQKVGKIRSIGVSNMTPKIWQEFIPQFKTIPAVNQVEFNPYFQQQELRALLAKDNVQVEAWAPLGQGNKELMNEPLLQSLAQKYQKNVGQIILRFENQEEIIALPKSVHTKRMTGNLNILDFELTTDELSQIRALDKNKGIHDPDAPGVAESLLTAFDVHSQD